MTTVVHHKKNKFDILIDRTTKWGNPYSHKKHSKAKFIVDESQDVITLYETWIRQQPELMACIPELEDKVLGCWCNGKRCHGTVLVKLVNEHKMQKLWS